MPNPLQFRPLAPVEYAALTRLVQSKASWLLKDHHEQLEVQMAAERADLEAEDARLRAVAETLSRVNNRRRQRCEDLEAMIATRETQFVKRSEVRAQLEAELAGLNETIHKLQERRKARRYELKMLERDPLTVLNAEVKEFNRAHRGQMSHIPANGLLSA